MATALTGSYAADRPPASPAEAQAIATFDSHVKEYVALHEKLESTLPRTPRKKTPEQVDKHQRALGDLIKAARHDAKPGEFFTPGMQALVKRILGEVLSGPDGKTLKASIMDENPGLPTLVVNERYPPSIPLSTMPPQVLAPLPKLHGELEYRFIGLRLILVDTEADIILDFTDDVLPK
ncbi:MAG TPA: hypothetical protein VFB49_10095 [Patescibacteria group bacterium]|nr:hypothetical protein [Patescibacteria group bacterium]